MTNNVELGMVLKGPVAVNVNGFVNVVGEEISKRSVRRR